MAISDSAYRLVIIAHYMRSGISNREDEIYEADIYEPSSEQLDSQISDQPLINGDTISDHMFREPMTKTFSGKFSLNGNKPSNFSGGYDRLANIQQTFEYINKNGVFCTLICQNKGDSSKFRFLKRENMVLKSITWTPGLNTLGFSFTFREVMAVELINIEEKDWEDEDLPDITDGALGSFTSELLDTQEVLEIIVATLANYDLITQDFLTYWGANIKQDVLLALGISIAVGTAIALAIGTVVAIATGAITTATTVVGGIVAASVAAGPVGWIIGGAVAFASFMAWGIYALIQAARKAENERIFTKAFELTKDEAEDIKECERLAKYLSDVYNELESLNDVCSVYSIPDSNNQECMICIDDEYYIFKFSSNNTNDGKVVLDVINQEGNTISANNLVEAAVKGVNECNENNRLFITSGGFRAYIINCAPGAEEFNLSNFKLLITQINMNDFSKVLEDLTINAMKKVS